MKLLSCEDLMARQMSNPDSNSVIFIIETDWLLYSYESMKHLNDLLLIRTSEASCGTLYFSRGVLKNAQRGLSRYSEDRSANFSDLEAGRAALCEVEFFHREAIRRVFGKDAAAGRGDSAQPVGKVVSGWRLDAIRIEEDIFLPLALEDRDAAAAIPGIDREDAHT